MAKTYYCTYLVMHRDSASQYRINNVSTVSTSINGTQSTVKKIYFFKDDVVIQKTTGKSYKCTKAGYYMGASTEALFKEDGIAAVNKPVAPKNLSTPTRSNYTYSSKWTAPNTASDNASRPTYTWAGWIVNLKEWPYKKEYWVKLGASASSSSFNFNDFIEYYDNKRYSRSSFYPVTSRKVTSITCSIGHYNDAGSRWANSSYIFEKPRKPTIDGWTFNKNNGEVTFHIKTNAGTDRYERHDTWYIVKLRSANGSWSEVWNTTTTSTDLTRTIDLQNYASLTYSQYYQIKVEAWSRGLAGNSDHVAANYYVGFPALATIKKASVTGSTLEGRFTVNLATNSTSEHYVQQVKLEYLADVTYKTAAEIPGSLPSGEAWVDSGIVDDAQCGALSVATQNLIPSPGKYTWYRIKTWCRNEEVLYRYTEPRRITQLEKPAPTAQDEHVKILEAVSLSAAYNDGQTVALLLGWNVNGQDDATGTELTWTTDVNGWRSVTAPSAYEFSWSDGQVTRGGVTYRDSATIYIHNLEENVPVFFKARRYMVDADERVTYSTYSNTFTATPSKLVAASEVNVSVIADANVAANKAYQVEWSYDTDVVQTQYMVVAQSGTTIMTGTGTNQACQIPPERLATFANNGKVTYTVRVLVSGAWIKSATRTVEIIPVPELSLDVPATLAAQPLSFGATCNQPVSMRVVVSSEGVDGQRPSGIKRQANGDIIYSALLTPEWTLSAGNYTTTIELPSGLDFINNGNYTIEATPINASNMEGEAQEGTVNIEWTHEAGLPNATVTTINETDEIGHTMAVQIELAAPEDADEEDVYDIYRVTGDGATLVMEGIEQTGVVIDKCAPFGNVPTCVRVATRTVDGDTNFFDYYYDLAGDFLRVDWEDQYVELPYNINIQDAYTKDVDIRKHMDGTQDGYWNAAVSRNASLGSTLVQVWQQGDVDKLKALARYTGAAFVRTPDGSAYTADVQVTDLTPNGNRLTTVALSATEIDLVESFKAEKVEEE